MWKKRSALLALALLVSVIATKAVQASTYSASRVQMYDGILSQIDAPIYTNSDGDATLLGFRGSDGHPHTFKCYGVIECIINGPTGTLGSIFLNTDVTDAIAALHSATGTLQSNIDALSEQQDVFEAAVQVFAMDVYANKEDSLGVGEDYQVLTSFEGVKSWMPASTTTTADGISDATEVGRDVLTASDAAAARAAIGAGTGSGTVTSVAVTSSNLDVSGSPVTGSGSISVSLPNSGVTPGSYRNVTVDATGRVTAATNTAPTFATSPSLGSCRQVSSTRDALVKYNYRLSGILTLTEGAVILESFTDSGCTANAVELDRISAGGLALNPSASGNVTGPVTAGRYVKARLSGSATVAANAGWEWLQ